MVFSLAPSAIYGAACSRSYFVHSSATHDHSLPPRSYIDYHNFVVITIAIMVHNRFVFFSASKLLTFSLPLLHSFFAEIFSSRAKLGFHVCFQLISALFIFSYTHNFFPVKKNFSLISLLRLNFTSRSEPENSSRLP